MDRGLLSFLFYDFCIDHLPWFWHLALQKMFLLWFHSCSRCCFHWHHVKPNGFVMSTAPNHLFQTKGFSVFMLNFQWFFSKWLIFSSSLLIAFSRASNFADIKSSDSVTLIRDSFDSSWKVKSSFTWGSLYFLNNLK